MAKKVLLIQEKIMNYRVPVFNELAKNVDLTVLYSSGEKPKDVNFKTICIPTRKMIFRIHTKNIYSLAQKYDIVICMADFSYIYFKLLYKLPHKYKLIFWGIGVSASYNMRYDQDSQVAQIIFNILKKADAMVFYCSYPVDKYSKMGIEREKLFVANNTVLIKDIEEKEKNSIIFIGTLYKQKKINYLLDGYLNAFKKNSDIYNLKIIGDGDEYENIQKWITDNSLENKVELLGSIYDEGVLAEHFSEALLCFSPDQAGLSVLKSMGYGVPFVTHKNAITGGEIFNINDGVNGILMDDFNQIENIILDSMENKEKYIEMGRKAKEHYKANRTVDKMVSGFIDAINYVESK